MPKTPRKTSSAASTLSHPPSGSTLPVSSSISAPVIAIDSPVSSSSVSVYSSVPPSAIQPLLITDDGPLPSGGQFDFELFKKFQLFYEWEKKSHPPSGASVSVSVTPTSISAPRPVYTLAPSVLSCRSNPPSSDLDSLGLARLNFLASSRCQGAHALPLQGEGPIPPWATPTT